MVIVHAAGCYVIDKSAAREIPVHGKGVLHRGNHPAGYTQVCVAPETFSLLAHGIPVGYVHAADICHLVVDYHNLAVVAPVDSCAEPWKCYLEERSHGHASAAHALEKCVGCAEGTHVVVDHPHSHAGSGAFDEYVGYFVAGVVVFYYIVLEVDRLRGLAQIVLKSVEFLFAAVKDTYAVARVVLCAGEGASEVDLLDRLIGEPFAPRIGLYSLFPASKPPAVAAGNHAGVLYVAAEEQI